MKEILMNEIIIYVAIGIVGVFAIIGLITLLVLTIFAADASVKGLKNKNQIFNDIKNEFNVKLADHKRLNMNLILEKKCKKSDAITAKKLSKCSQKTKKPKKSSTEKAAITASEGEPKTAENEKVERLNIA